MSRNLDISQSLASLGLSQSEFARLVGITDRNVRRYVAGDVEVAGAVLTLLQLMIERPEIISVLREVRRRRA